MFSDRQLDRIMGHSLGVNDESQSLLHQVIDSNTTLKKQRKGIKVSEWQGCYDGGWQGLIVPDAFARP
uniref:Uncharacterized protein n=1 Tax=viral metagenome TaxID=1070528 RepID=A0A6M3XSY8_9ZZZZ